MLPSCKTSDARHPQSVSLRRRLNEATPMKKKGIRTSYIPFFYFLAALPKYKKESNSHRFPPRWNPTLRRASLHAHWPPRGPLALEISFRRAFTSKSANDNLILAWWPFGRCPDPFYRGRFLVSHLGYTHKRIIPLVGRLPPPPPSNLEIFGPGREWPSKTNIQLRFTCEIWGRNSSSNLTSHLPSNRNILFKTIKDSIGCKFIYKLT